MKGSNLDSRIRDSFFKAYRTLYREGSISLEQLMEVGTLIEGLENRYQSADHVRARLQEIFPARRETEEK